MGYHTTPEARRQIADDGPEDLRTFCDIMQSLSDSAEAEREEVVAILGRARLDFVADWVVRVGVNLKLVAKGQPVELEPLIEAWPRVVQELRALRLGRG